MTLASCILTGNVAETKDSLMISAIRKHMCGDRIFKSFLGMLLGPMDFPVFMLTYDVSGIFIGIAGVIKNECSFLVPRKSMGDLALGMENQGHFSFLLVPTLVTK